MKEERGRYWVFVEEEGKGREFVDSFGSLHLARDMVRKFELNKADHIKNQDELSYHYKNLSWKIVDMGAK